MGQTRTLGAVKSYYSKNRKRLDLDRLIEEGSARAAGADLAHAVDQVCPSFSVDNGRDKSATCFPCESLGKGVDHDEGR
jgi:hypothetical protein